MIPKQTPIVLALAGTLAFVAMAGGACSRSQPPPVERSRTEAGATSPEPTGPPRVHTNGLLLDPQPAAFTVKETAAGFRIEPADARRMRSPWSIELGLADANPAGAAGDQSKKLGERDARYHVTADEEAGSGGPLNTWTAWLALRAGDVALGSLIDTSVFVAVERGMQPWPRRLSAWTCRRASTPWPRLPAEQ